MTAVTDDSYRQVTDTLLALARKADMLVPAEDIRPDSVLIGAAAICDSMSLLRFLMAIETHFGIEIVNQELGADVLTSIGSLASHIADVHRPAA